MSAQSKNQPPDHDDVIDVEEYHKEGKPVPPGKRYRIRINKDKYLVDKECMTGRELLEISSHNPPDAFILYQLFGKNDRKVIALDDTVCFTAPGVERFKSIPKEHNDGEEAGITLPPDDVEMLNNTGLKWEIILEGNSRWLLFRDYPLPEGYTSPCTDMIIQIQDSYMSAGLDMAYFNPPLVLLSGKAIARTESTISVQGKTWQRWSRHYKWIPGQHSLETHLTSVELWLSKEVMKQAA